MLPIFLYGGSRPFVFFSYCQCNSVYLNLTLSNSHFYRVMRMHDADYAVARCLSVRLSVYHTPVICLNGYTCPQRIFTIG